MNLTEVARQEAVWSVIILLASGTNVGVVSLWRWAVIGRCEELERRIQELTIAEKEREMRG